VDPPVRALHFGMMTLVGGIAMFLKPSRYLFLFALVACRTTPEAPSVFQPAPPGAICTMEARPAISVEPIDRRTGQHITGDVRLIVRDGMYVDTAFARLTSSARSISAAYERSGTYEVTVEHRNFRVWERAGVGVRRDECHVQTVRLRAELQPSGQ
jgi:hypothetical protein